MATDGVKQEAAGLKKQGNDHYQAGEYAKALDAYSRSIELNPQEHTTYSNRSAAYLKLGNSAAEALADAVRCVELAPTWAKGYSRQASALQELKRWDEAVAACQRGLKESSGDGLKKMIEEVRVRQFSSSLLGTWHGTVKENLGGYEQEMEFCEGAVVRVEVLGRSITGQWWVDASAEPFHLNIQVPVTDMPPMGMPPAPPVPYIARIDAAGLHLCCPVLRMDRPTEFEGDGYCLMVRGAMQSADDAEVSTLSWKEKLQKCVKDVIKAVPDAELKDINASDSEEQAREKVMKKVRFETAMYAVQKKYGEAVMKEVLECARQPNVPHEVLSAVKEMEILREKLMYSGIMPEDEPGVSAPAPQAPISRSMQTPAAAPAQSGAAPAARANGDDEDEASGDDGQMVVAIGVALGITALAAAALMLWRRHKQ